MVATYAGCQLTPHVHLAGIFFAAFSVMGAWTSTHTHTNAHTHTRTRGLTHFKDNHNAGVTGLYCKLKGALNWVCRRAHPAAQRPGLPTHARLRLVCPREPRLLHLVRRRGAGRASCVDDTTLTSSPTPTPTSLRVNMRCKPRTRIALIAQHLFVGFHRLQGGKVVQRGDRERHLRL